MKACVLGGAGFLGRKIVRVLAQKGYEIVVGDVAPMDFSDLGKQVRVMRTDITQFEDVMAALVAAKPELLFNLSYLLGDYLPRPALKVNIFGMDNAFEAARLCGVERVVFASSIAVNGGQRFYDYKPITEDDPTTAYKQYGIHKVFNEWQAREYNQKHGMSITAVRPGNVAGVEKLIGSVDHVRCVVLPALGQAARFTYKDRMRSCIYIDDVADIMVKVAEKRHPEHPVYNTGGETLSLGQIADMVRKYIPEADISFEQETGGEFEKGAGAYLFNNDRIVREFGLQLPPYEQRIKQMIDIVRSREAAR